MSARTFPRALSGSPPLFSPKMLPAPPRRKIASGRCAPGKASKSSTLRDRRTLRLRLSHTFSLSLSLSVKIPLSLSLSLCSTVELEPGSPEEEFNSPTTACAISKSHDGDEEAHNSLTHSLRRRRHVWSVGPASSHSGSIERIVTGRCTGDDR